MTDVGRHTERCDAHETGIERLRIAVSIFDRCRESFLEPFSARDLLRIYDAHMQCEWDLYPDQWTDRQVDEAVRLEFVPKFRFPLPGEDTSLLETVEGLVPVYTRP